MDHDDLTQEEMAWLVKIASGDCDEWGATPTINALVARGYVRWDDQRLRITEKALAVVATASTEEM